ncbi:MAG: hypothetical protein ABEJ61_08670 [Haloferacaceae archaeon]
MEQNRPLSDPRAPARACRAALARGVAGLQRLAFWVAVAFPLVYVAALVPDSPVAASGLELGAAVAVHAAALVVGHGHTPAGVATSPTDRASTAVEDATRG